jgi:hypothetical protein
MWRLRRIRTRTGVEQAEIARHEHWCTRYHNVSIYCRTETRSK